MLNHPFKYTLLAQLIAKVHRKAREKKIMKILVSFRINESMIYCIMCVCARKKVKGHRSQTQNIHLIFCFSFTCNQISVTVLLCQWNSICADPGIVEVSPQFRRSRGEKSIVSTKLQSSNLITDDDKSTTAPSTTSPSATIQSFKITADDVVMGTNTVYGTHAQIQNGGIIYAFNQGQGSTGQPLMSAGESKI